jgi:hypothetical protein
VASRDERADPPVRVVHVALRAGSEPHGDPPMQYVVMHKASAKDEAGGPVPQQIVQDMGRFIGDAIKAGVFLNGDGLHPSSRRARVSCRGGQWTVTKGPYAGERELPAAFAAIRVRTQDDAIAWAKRFAAACGGDVDLEVGALVEHWDLGGPKPEGDVPLRFLVILKANAGTEAGRAPTAARSPALAKLLDAATRDGTLLYHETLQPSARAHRLVYTGGKRRVLDGPFAESKELVGGFSIVQMRSLDEVLVWVDRYAQILGGTLEVDVRPVAAGDGGAK